MTVKIKLTGGLDKTTTWIWLENGLLKVEFYDFSESAQEMFGNDIAYTLTVAEMEKLFITTNQSEKSLLPWMTGQFKSYFDIKAWLEENNIGFSIERESHA